MVVPSFLDGGTFRWGYYPTPLMFGFDTFVLNYRTPATTEPMDIDLIE